MSKTIVVTGYGAGISHAVAERFGSEGFSVALIARNEASLKEGVRKLSAKGIKAEAFPCDAGDIERLRATIQKARSRLGAITALHWNAAAPVAGDLLTASTEELRSAIDVGVTGLVAAVQELLPDLKAAKTGAVLVTNGGFGAFDAGIDAWAVQSSSMGLAIANSAKHKTVRLLAKRLESEGVFVGEVMVFGLVKGTRWDQGNATLDAADIASKFWKLYSERKESLSRIP
jgi:NADP-dependent 3-hydroxy acid dehydrogenase YdfG